VPRSEPDATARLSLCTATVKPEWIDYNGHMSEAYYVLTFGFASEAFLDYIHLGSEYRSDTGSSVYTVEAHINYLREVAEGAGLHFATQLLGYDARRIHLFRTMSHAGDGAVLATTELMMVHVDEQPRVSPMPQATLDRVRTVHESQRDIPVPDHAGRTIGLRG
jgi:acyl-CoA thioester hydrolase